MNKILGIWLPDYNVDLSKLKRLGFNGIIIRSDWYDNDTFEDYLKRLWKLYCDAYQNGFKFFVVDFSQGLGKYDNNYNYVSVYKMFQYEEGIIFYIGEPYENYIETGLLTEEQMKDMINDKLALIKYQVFMDATVRNYMKMYLNFYPNYAAISSYYNQHKYWLYTNAIWIYGQLKLGGSLRYKFLSEQANKYNIQIRLLYQGDSDKFDIKKPYTWLNALLRLLGLRKIFEKWQRKRFIKYFKYQEI